MAPGGYFGAALLVEVAGGKATTARLPLDEAVLRGHLGGVGLGAWLLHELVPTGVDPLAPEAPLAFVFSPLVGTPLTTSAKYAVVAKSPLTGLLTDSLASGQFAIAGKLTGHDAIVVRGRADALSVLLVEGTGVRLEPAPEVAGLPAADAEAALGERFGRGWRAAVTGPAGERGVRYATISHDGRHAGRGGLGAVLGSKNLKAVLVRAGPRRPPIADEPSVLAAAADLRARSFGPATRAHRELGTLGSLLDFNAVAALPGRNFTEVGVAGADRLAPQRIRELRATTRGSCASCSIGCEHIYSRKGARSGGRKATRAAGGQRLEFQNAAALGPACGVTDPEVVLAASARCDTYGIDTISAGGTVAWAMECAERGLIDEPWLRFGDGDALLRALNAIGNRSPGLGELLALGSRSAAAIVGGASIDFAPQVKGLELPGHEPRTLHAAALGLAVNARGADHNRSGAHEADLSGAVTPADGVAAHVAAAIDTEDRAAAMDSMILCSFLRGVFTDPFTEWAALLAPVTGWDIDADELHATARRIVDAKRSFNLREGATAADDTLPARMLATGLQLPDGESAELTADRLLAMTQGYYAARGWDVDGRPPTPVPSRAPA